MSDGDYQNQTSVNNVVSQKTASTRTTTEKPSSVESRETVTVTKSMTFNATVKPDAEQLKQNITVESCKMRKSERALRWNLDECQKSIKGKRYRKVRVDEETKQSILSLYSGMFHTRREVAEIEKSRQKTRGRKKHRTTRSTDVEHDGDMCCPSISRLERAPDLMENTGLQMREIVHFESDDVFQYINKGYCVSTIEQSCSGICVPVTRMVYLLVWKDPLPTDTSLMPMVFEAFDISSFCSCKNIFP